MKDNGREILNNYKGLLDFAKSSMTYLAVFIALTAIFGFVYLYSFLFYTDLLWLSTSIEYKTILSWGIPISITFFIATALNIFIHKLSNSFTFNQLYLIWIILIAIVLVYFLFPSFSRIVMQYIILFVLSLNIGFMISGLIDIKIAKVIDIKIVKIKLTTAMHLSIIFTVIIFLFVINMLGKRYYIEFEKGNYPAFAQIKGDSNTVYGVVLNNNGSFVIRYLEKIYLVKIVKPDELNLFIQLDKARIMHPELFKESDKNMTQNLDQNKSLK